MEEPGTSRGAWSDNAILALISYYREYEADLENGLKKRTVWDRIVRALHELGHNFTRNSVECKWHYLVKCYNRVKTNKKTTGQNRKTFQIFHQMDEVLSKHHDINPPVVSGSGCVENVFSEHTKNLTSSKRSSASCATDDDSSENETSLTLSGSKAAKRRRKNRQKSKDSSNDLLEFLRETEQQRKEEAQKRDEGKERRHQEKTQLLRDCLAELGKI